MKNELDNFEKLTSYWKANPENIYLPYNERISGIVNHMNGTSKVIISFENHPDSKQSISMNEFMKLNTIALE